MDLRGFVEKKVKDTYSRQYPANRLSIFGWMINVSMISVFAAVFGFAWWDRRSILITARAEVEASTQDIRGTALRSERLIEVLQSFAENVPNLKVLMRQANLL